MPKFTPGPWEYQERSDDYTHIVRGPHERFIVQLSQDTSGVAEANARLISKAPEMYGILKWLCDFEEDWDITKSAKELLKQIDGEE